MFALVSKPVTPTCTDAHYTLLDGKMELNDHYAALGLEPWATTLEIESALQGQHGHRKCLLQYCALQITYRILINEWRLHYDALYWKHKGVTASFGSDEGGVRSPGMVQMRIDLINHKSARALAESVKGSRPGSATSSMKSTPLGGVFTPVESEPESLAAGSSDANTHEVDSITTSGSTNLDDDTEATVPAPTPQPSEGLVDEAYAVVDPMPAGGLRGLCCR